MSDLPPTTSQSAPSSQPQQIQAAGANHVVPPVGPAKVGGPNGNAIKNGIAAAPMGTPMGAPPATSWNTLSSSTTGGNGMRVPSARSVVAPSAMTLAPSSTPAPRVSSSIPTNHPSNPHRISYAAKNVPVRNSAGGGTNGGNTNGGSGAVKWSVPNPLALLEEPSKHAGNAGAAAVTASNNTAAHVRSGTSFPMTTTSLRYAPQQQQQAQQAAAARQATMQQYRTQAQAASQAQQSVQASQPQAQVVQQQQQQQPYRTPSQMTQQQRVISVPQSTPQAAQGIQYTHVQPQAIQYQQQQQQQSQQAQAQQQQQQLASQGYTSNPVRVHPSMPQQQQQQQQQQPPQQQATQQALQRHPAPQSQTPTSQPSTSTPATTSTTNKPRRKLHLSPEGRQALMKAVLSPLQSPTGHMDPRALAHAMALTGLSETAIRNAAQMAREKERKRVMAMQQQQNQQQQQQIQSQQQQQTTRTTGVPILPAQAQGGGGMVQQHSQSQQQPVVASNPTTTSRSTPVPGVVPTLSGQTVLGTTPSTTTQYRTVQPQPHSLTARNGVVLPTPSNRYTAVGGAAAAQGTAPSTTTTNPVTMTTTPNPMRAPGTFVTTHPSTATTAHPTTLVPTPVVGTSTHHAHLTNPSNTNTTTATTTSSLTPTPNPSATNALLIQQQNKAIQEAAKRLSVEARKWGRVHHGIFVATTAAAPIYRVAGGSIIQGTGSSKGQTTWRLLPNSLGGAVRCRDSSAPLLEMEIPDVENGREEEEKEEARKQMWKEAAKIQAQLKQRNLPGPMQKVGRRRALGSLLSQATVPLLDVTDKYKRLKLQPRKESKLLERNLKKHCQITAEVLIKKQKEMNKSILSHGAEFFKFHRLRKAEISRFARSVRDHVNLLQKKKEKGEVLEEKERLAALRANDMAAYTALVQDTKNDRLKFLLTKTDECMNQISGLLQDQQNGGSGLKNVQATNTSYYDSAHVNREEIRQPSILVGGKLKDYQLGGLQWLVSLYNNKLNGILADEMGLGKTIQTIGLIAYLMEFKENGGPYLVIVPLSTLSNWVNEFRRWCPSATVIVYKGTPAQRKGLFKSEVREGHFNILLTTYEYIIKDKASLRKLQWQYAIVDEGHRMKNAQSKFAVTLGTQYVTRNRILLTGTPLQNSLPELWALLNFLLPTIFNSVETFDQWFNKPFAQFGATGDDSTEEIISNEEKMLIIQRLHELLRPFMLRRIKADVLDQLPDKVEKVLKCDLSSWQKELYKQISYNILANGEKSSKRGLNNVVMQLRKVCNHPYMFSSEGYYITEEIIRTSGKVELLDRMLPKLKAAGHRVLMFFQMTQAMTILEDYFKLRNILTLRLDGSTTGEERERRMDLFNAPNSPYDVFMLSTRAGGLGLNLVTADTVIIFDSDWNPMMDLQAQDRAHRIGQKKIVSVFRLVTNSPVEEKILSRATEKLNMSEIIVEAGKFDKSSVEEDTSEERQKIMEVLLTDWDTNTSGHAATGALPDDDDAENDQEEIDFNELLARSDDDYEIYSKIDRGEIQVEDFFTSPGLLTDPDDIPDWIKYPNGKEENKGDGSGAGARRTASQAVYNDGLTERQFLRLVENQAEKEEEEAKARKLEWRQKREKNAAERGKEASTSTEQSTSTSSGAIPEQINNKLISICKCVIALKDKNKRRRSDIFREKPCATTYPDYYQKIQKPIGINDIVRKCRSKGYFTTKAFVDDWKLLFSNARQYNGEGSWIDTDAVALNSELERLLNKNNIVIEEPPRQSQPPKKKKLRIKLSLKRKSPVPDTEDDDQSSSNKGKKPRTGI